MKKILLLILISLSLSTQSYSEINAQESGDYGIDCEKKFSSDLARNKFDVNIVTGGTLALVIFGLISGSPVAFSPALTPVIAIMTGFAFQRSSILEKKLSCVLENQESLRKKMNL